jgi:hypothetical protein
MNNTGSSVPAWAWEQLEDHVRLQAQLLQRFASADPSIVVRMWRTGTNELGKPLSMFEREALVERHCQLFGYWPGERRP